MGVHIDETKLRNILIDAAGTDDPVVLSRLCSNLSNIQQALQECLQRGVLAPDVLDRLSSGEADAVRRVYMQEVFGIDDLDSQFEKFRAAYEKEMLPQISQALSDNCRMIDDLYAGKAFLGIDRIRVTESDTDMPAVISSSAIPEQLRGETIRGRYGDKFNGGEQRTPLINEMKFEQ